MSKFISLYICYFVVWVIAILAGIAATWIRHSTASFTYNFIGTFNIFCSIPGLAIYTFGEADSSLIVIIASFTIGLLIKNDIFVNNPIPA